MYPFQMGPGVQESKQEVRKIVSFVKEKKIKRENLPDVSSHLKWGRLSLSQLLFIQSAMEVKRRIVSP